MVLCDAILAPVSTNSHQPAKSLFFFNPHKVIEVFRCRYPAAQISEHAAIRCAADAITLAGADVCAGRFFVCRVDLLIMQATMEVSQSIVKHLRRFLPWAFWKHPFFHLAA
jgi:hypothetical protein